MHCIVHALSVHAIFLAAAFRRAGWEVALCSFENERYHQKPKCDSWAPGTPWVLISDDDFETLEPFDRVLEIGQAFRLKGHRLIGHIDLRFTDLLQSNLASFGPASPAAYAAIGTADTVTYQHSFSNDVQAGSHALRRELIAAFPQVFEDAHSLWLLEAALGLNGMHENSNWPNAVLNALEFGQSGTDARAEQLVELLQHSREADQLAATFVEAFNRRVLRDQALLAKTIAEARPIANGIVATTTLPRWTIGVLWEKLLAQGARAVLFESHRQTPRLTRVWFATAPAEAVAQQLSEIGFTQGSDSSKFSFRTVVADEEYRRIIDRVEVLLSHIP